tara:strand:- start:352 stop:1059 length:708 start_codon:yes stop_codon:yes gene_type:complete
MFISIVGPNGFVGNKLVNYFKKKRIKVLKIDRKFKFEKVPNNIKIVIHTANSSQKFEADKNPNSDFISSIKLTKKIAKVFKSKKIILISTISTRTEKNVYAINRKKCEKIILKLSKKNIIFRLPILFNTKLKRGILYDLVKDKKLYIKKDTLINPVSLDEICDYIFKNLNSKKQIHEIASSEKISIYNLSKQLNSKSKFGKRKVDLLAQPSKYNRIKLSKILNELKSYKANKINR